MNSVGWPSLFAIGFGKNHFLNQRQSADALRNQALDNIPAKPHY